MALLVLSIVAIWTMLVFRLLCFRTTLGFRTLASWGVLGALLGPVAVPLAYRFFNSYRFDGSQWYVLLILLAQQLLMALPAFVLLGRPGWRRASSVSDAFLAAFAMGLGYEFMGTFLAVAHSSTIANGLAFLPPGTATNGTVTVAGFAYWSGLIALAAAAAYRFTRSGALAYAAGAVALACSVLDNYADTSSAPAAQQILSITLHGNLLPWVTIALLIGCVLLEARWAKARNSMKLLVAEMQAVATATFGLNFAGAYRAGLAHRLRRQSENLAAALERESGNAQILQQAKATNEVAAKLGQGSYPASSAGRWLARRWPELVAVAAFLIVAVVLIMPGMESAATWLWSTLPMATPLAPLQLTLAETVLALLVAWQFVRAPGRAFSGVVADETAQFWAERRILQAGFAVILIAMLYPHPQEFIGFQSNLDVAAGLTPPEYTDVQAVTVMLLLAWAAGGLTARRAERWRSLKTADHLGSLVHNFVTACSTGIVAWLGFAFFAQVQTYAHANWGPKAWYQYHANGNSVLEMFVGLATVAFAFAAAWGVRFLAKRFEETFLTAAGAGR